MGANSSLQVIATVISQMTPWARSPLAFNPAYVYVQGQGVDAWFSTLESHVCSGSGVHWDEILS